VSSPVFAQIALLKETMRKQTFFFNAASGLYVKTSARLILSEDINFP
jgi:hypothetical protein